MAEVKQEAKTMTVLEQLKKLEEQRATLLEGAKKEALAKAEAAVADLNAIGFDYRLVEGDEEPEAKKKIITRHRDPNEPCSVCGYCTNPPHDARKHRSQGAAKKPFTDRQLAELSLTKK